MKKFRNPYLALILSFLVVNISCSEPNVYNSDNINSELLSETIKEHLLITKEVTKTFLEEVNVDFDELNNFPAYFKNTEELRKSLKKANFKNDEKISILFNKLNNNIENFLLSIENIENYSQTDLVNLLVDEIDNQFESKTVNRTNYFLKSDPCLGALHKAEENCGENYAISVAVVIASSFITFGTTTVVGYVAATALLVKCSEDAASAYRNCSSQSESQ